MKWTGISQVMLRTITFLFVATIVFSALPDNVYAETATGRVTFVGTMQERYFWDSFSAVFRVRLTDTQCGGVTQPERWIHVVSGRMDGVYAHNSANFRNAYNTIMSAFLSGKNIQIDGVPSCDASAVQDVYLWNSTVGIY